MPAKRKATEVEFTGAPSTVAAPITDGTDANAKLPTKRAKKEANKPEKRAARIRNSPPKAICDRLDRVMCQRFFMVDRSRNGDELSEAFSVLGSTGNVYTVRICHKPTCDCPDAQKGNHCKHILFVFMKVLHVPMSSPNWYQAALITPELEEIFANAPPSPAAAAPDRVRAAYAKATGKASATDIPEESDNKRLPTKDDDCPVCYEGMHGAAASHLVWCDGCGNALHKECFQQWARSTPKLTCVYCRRAWTSNTAGAAGASISADGYLNLAAVAGVDTERDSGTYYSGPRRGEGFGYFGRGRYY